MVRGVILLVVPVLACLTVASGIAMAGRKANPALVAKLAPFNAFVQASVARNVVQIDPVKAEEAARNALWRDPTQASAAGTLGLALVQRGQLYRGMALLDYSERISRRDLQVQLWGIELAAERGDIEAALHHYDVALRIGRETPELLFPTLANAITDPLVRDHLAEVLARDTPWKASFFDYLTPRTSDVVSAARLINLIYQRGGQVAVLPVNVLIQRLIESDNVELAWSMYAHIKPRASRLGIRNGSFEVAVDYPSALDWTFKSAGETWAEVVTTEKGNALEMAAQAGTGGTVAYQTLLLKPGSYRISFNSAARESEALGSSTLRVRCLSTSSSPLIETLLAPAGRRQSRTFTVPAGCQSQSLEINLYSGDSDRAISGTIDDIAIASTRV
jgi:hypothetical protein